MRICILGNSQIGALKLGWEKIRARHPGVEITFFGGPGDTMKHFAVQDGALVAGTDRLRENLRTTAGSDRLDPGAYDVFVVAGYNQGHEPYLDRRLSASVRALTLADRFATSGGTELARRLRSLTDAPIVLIGAPLRKEGGTSTPTATANYLPVELEPAIEAEAAQAGFAWLGQPRETVTADGFWTRAAYSQGAIRLADERGGGTEADARREDMVHKNADFGALVITTLLDRLVA
ncbi:MAG: hypothetical protein KDK12_12435 [Rhodobacteraceae bacterium]|nr:hypothetical protein [Paracoccaceae bacterium]